MCGGVSVGTIPSKRILPMLFSVHWCAEAPCYAENHTPDTSSDVGLGAYKASFPDFLPFDCALHLNTRLLCSAATRGGGVLKFACSCSGQKSHCEELPPKSAWYQSASADTDFL